MFNSLKLNTLFDIFVAINFTRNTTVLKQRLIKVGLLSIGNEGEKEFYFYCLNIFNLLSARKKIVEFLKMISCTVCILFGTGIELQG